MQDEAAPASPSLVPSAAPGDNEAVVFDQRSKVSRFKLDPANPTAGQWAEMGVLVVRLYHNSAEKR